MCLTFKGENAESTVAAKGSRNRICVLKKKIGILNVVLYNMSDTKVQLPFENLYLSPRTKSRSILNF